MVDCFVKDVDDFGFDLVEWVGLISYCLDEFVDFDIDTGFMHLFTQTGLMFADGSIFLFTIDIHTKCMSVFLL